jgi:toxin ParE2
VYYGERLHGLGTRFAVAVQATVERVAAIPDLGTSLNLEYRKRSVPGFPFNVIYWITREAVFGVAIAHQRRRPGYWFGRRGG